MAKRFVTIWFRHLKTDWFSIRQPALRDIPFVLSAPDHGRMVITAANERALAKGIESGMVVADARAIFPSLEVLDDDPALSEKLLKAIAEWCIRYTNIVAIDSPNGIIMDVTGSAHLWGGEKKYISDIHLRLKNRGYNVRATIADSIGTAWAIAHFGANSSIVESGKQMESLLSLPPSALRLELNVADRLHKLGLHQIRNFINMPRSALRRRFGKDLILKLDQALGNEEEAIISVQPIEPWRERLPCLEPIITSTGIAIALQRLLDTICQRMKQEGMGIRKAVFTGFRADGKLEKLEIGTHRATLNAKHLYKLFEEKISTIEPDPGIELFMIEALKAEKISPHQEKLWDAICGLENPGLSELMDRLTNRFGNSPIRRFLPSEHYMPEKTFKESISLEESTVTPWLTGRPRPLQILSRPELIEVTAPIPDYPPMLFRYLGKLHKIKKADGPERIEQEWWIQHGPHRDYYAVEDEEGQRYWLFRSGHYEENEKAKWFIHGFFS
ncbi:MAG: DNA polymerase Y family protein [Puia sp.]